MKKHGEPFFVEDHVWKNRSSGDVVWQTETGLMISLKAMTDQHLKNCLRMLEDNTEGWRKGYLPHLRAELVSRITAQVNQEELEELEENERYQPREI